MFRIFDYNGKLIGVMKVKSDGTGVCYDERNKVLGRIAQSGNQLFAYNGGGGLLGRFDGVKTFDKHNNVIGRQNKLYYLLYPNLAEIR